MTDICINKFTMFMNVYKIISFDIFIDIKKVREYGS